MSKKTDNKAKKTAPVFIDKELSWLSFNERVLQEAADKTVPIIERARFLGIFSNNLDEFFRVRFADVKRQNLIAQKTTKSNNADLEALLNSIQAKALELQEKFDTIYGDILIGLARRNIFLINEDQITEDQYAWVRKHFRDEILPHLVPIFITDKTDLVKSLKDGLTYLAIEITQGKKVRYAALEIPADDLPRFVRLPKQKDGRRKSLILLDNIIRFCLEELFTGLIGKARYRSYAFKVTRDAEFNVGDEIDESLLEKMSDGLKQRVTAEPTRFVYDRAMPANMLEFFIGKLKISNYDGIIPGGRYHNFKDFMSFPALGPNYLLNKKLRALDCSDFDRHSNPFDAIRAGDILVYYPYYKFRYMAELVRHAACDPQVKRIKISIYRLAKDSLLVKSLIDATGNGKDVSVFMELKARFDEAANIEWAKILTDAGVKVEFGVPSLKVHSKLCLIERVENKKSVFYAHIGTGNFHEKTARIYTDFSLFTANQPIAKEVGKVFDNLTHMYKRPTYRHLVLSPQDTRRRYKRLINAEIEQAKKGRPAEIFIKINNITDEEIIKHLYKASQAGVKIRIIVRGMCCLVPGQPGLSENIEAISIVDRFLEHPRIMVFHNKGDAKVFISSADLMPRNLDSRIEVGCPIYNERLKKRILDILEIQWKDTTKARIIDADLSNKYVARGNRKKVRSQISTHDYLSALEEKKKP